jgi:cytochrome oxidase Cu insertion factor (SCO1/SenC/PrrC family)
MSRGAAVLLALAVAVPRTVSAESPAAPELSYTYAIGPFAPEYTPPAPGSYALPVIDAIEDHPLLRSDGAATTLFAEKGHHLAIVAFVYTACAEAAGCPLSMAVLHRLDRTLAADSALRRRTVLLTISFDPARDTPARMARLRTLHRPESTWRFLTTRGDADLAPLLADFGQPVSPLRFSDGRPTGLFRHVLKVFLLDARNQVRNVYSAGFLNPDLVLNDLRTVLLSPAG